MYIKGVYIGFGFLLIYEKILAVALSNFLTEYCIWVPLYYGYLFLQFLCPTVFKVVSCCFADQLDIYQRFAYHLDLNFLIINEKCISC